MYSWIWRHLPFGTKGKVAGSALLALAAAALLWFLIFPAIDPHLPFNNDGGVSTDVQSPGQTAQPGQDSVVPPSQGDPDAVVPSSGPSLPS